MTIDGRKLENYAIVKLSNLNPKSDEIFKPLVAAGYEIIKREDPKGNTIDHIIVKDPTKDNIGKWIEEGSKYRCANCGCSIYPDDLYRPYQANYCPNCGEQKENP